MREYIGTLFFINIVKKVFVSFCDFLTNFFTKPTWRSTATFLCFFAMFSFACMQLFFPEIVTKGSINYKIGLFVTSVALIMTSIFNILNVNMDIQTQGNINKKNKKQVFISVLILALGFAILFALIFK